MKRRLIRAADMTERRIKGKPVRSRIAVWNGQSCGLKMTPHRFILAPITNNQGPQP
jgi:hypothetical protein